MKKVSILFFLVMFVIGTDTFLISPLLPTLTVSYHISPSISGWLISAYAIGYAVFALVAGPISDRLNRKKVMSCGLIAFSLSTILCGFASTFWLMILCRFFAGISASFVTPQVWASIPILVEKKSIVKTMGYATAGLSIAQMLGIPIGSFLASISWNIPFFALGFSSLFLLLIVSIFLQDIHPAKEASVKKKRFLDIYASLLGEKKAKQYFIAYFLFQTGNFAAFSFIGSWFFKSFHMQVASIGLAMIAIGLGNTIGSLFGSRLVKRLGLSKSLFFGILVSVFLYLILPFSTSIYFATSIYFLIFVVCGFIFPVFMTIFQTLSTSSRGTVSALTNTSMYAGTTIGGIIGGLLFSNISGFFGVCIFTALMYVLSLLVYRRSGVFKSSYGK